MEILHKLWLVTLVALTSSVAWGKPLKVLIDPGHGGRDSGATSHGLIESELVFDVAKELTKLLQKDSRFEAGMSRETKAFASLSQRVSKAHTMPADVLISIHANSSPEPSAKGLEVYFQNQLPPEEESLFLASLESHRIGHQLEAEDIAPVPKHPTTQALARFDGDVQNILQDLLRNEKVVKSSLLSKSIAETWEGSRKPARSTVLQAPFYVVTQSEIPTVLVEIGFVSNPKEAKRLKTPQYRHQIAKSLYRGLIQYKESIDNR